MLGITGWGGQHLHVAHQVVTTPVDVQHLMAHVAEVEGVESWRRRAWEIELAQRAVSADVRVVIHGDLTQEDAPGVYAVACVDRVRPLQHACSSSSRAPAGEEGWGNGVGGLYNFIRIRIMDRTLVFEYWRGARLLNMA